MAGWNTRRGRASRTHKDEKPAQHPRLNPSAFGERPGPEPSNASAMVALDDATWLLCDPNVGDALFALRLAADGPLAGPLLRRPLSGLAPGRVDDLAGMTPVPLAGGSLLLVMPSRSLPPSKRRHPKKRKRGKASPARNGLVRMACGAGARLEAEGLAGLRD